MYTSPCSVTTLTTHPLVTRISFKYLCKGYSINKLYKNTFSFRLNQYLCKMQYKSLRIYRGRTYKSFLRHYGLGFVWRAISRVAFKNGYIGIATSGERTSRTVRQIYIETTNLLQQSSSKIYLNMFF